MRVRAMVLDAQNDEEGIGESYRAPSTGMIVLGGSLFIAKWGPT